jgi:hypothetical protein
LSNSAYTFLFKLISSGTASITRSASFNACGRSTVGMILLNTSSASF